MQKELDIIAQLEKSIGYVFHDKKLILEALTHSSYANERKINKIPCNERLEFLGDAVLQLLSSDYLFHVFPDSPEGHLSKTRSSLVCEPTLAQNARDCGLADCVLLGKGESISGGRKKDSVTSDAFEAVIGAIYLDGGLSEAKRFVDAFALKDAGLHLNENDPKSALQQFLQKNGNAINISYRVASETGPEHDKSFHVEVLIDNCLAGEGTGHNKKSAEKAAAKDALAKLMNTK